MKFHGVEIPEILLSAQQDGRLVVFAGAGVSTPKPSNYPSFEKLARSLSPKGERREKQESIDRYLGRLHEKGVPVHNETKRILTNPTSEPNPLHFSLLKLFRDQKNIRLVTTNFDTHFTTSAEQLFSSIPEVFQAPALPWATDFAGIVHIHGSINQDSRHLILMDSDFGRAYLTEGWASSFLVKLFQSCTVLFVGYSHNDPVMTYIARALPPASAQSRYIMTTEDQAERWRRLNITPILYSDKESHEQLRLALENWAGWSLMGYLDHEKRITELAVGSPSIDPEDAAYLKRMLADPSCVPFFVRNARSVEWIFWANNASLLDELFVATSTPSKTSMFFSDWLARTFVVDNSDSILEMARRHNGAIGPYFWSALARELWMSATRPPSVSIGRLVSLLVTSPWPPNGGQDLTLLLQNIRIPEDTDTALVLFEELCRPEIELRPGWDTPSSGGNNPINFELTIRADEYALKETWSKLLRPNLGLLGIRLFPIVVSQLERAHVLLRSIGKADDIWDPLSFDRSAIEPEPSLDDWKSGFHKGLILIDFAREILEWVLTEQPDLARISIEQWIGSGTPILRRLAIHGMRVCPNLSSDERLSWLLDHELLYAPLLKHEVFMCLGQWFGAAPTDTQRRVVERALSGPKGRIYEDPSKDTNAYEVYNLLVALKQAAPQSVEITRALDEAKLAHPNFKPRERPDLDVTIGGGWVSSSSPLTVEQLLEKGPHEIVDYLLSFEANEFDGPSREGLLVTASQAITQRYEWGRDLASLLSSRGDWKEDLWKAILRGFEQGIKDGQQLAEAARILRAAEPLHVHEDSLSDFLNSCSKQEMLLSTKESREAISQFVEHFFDEHEKVVTEASLDKIDWLTAAINAPGGKLTLALLHTISQDRRDAGDSWSGLNRPIQDLFNTIIQGCASLAVFGRVILASNFHFLLSLDREWALKSLLPVLDWQDSSRSEQAWHGFLGWGKLNPDVVDVLLPFYIKTSTHLEKLGELRQRFVMHIAWLMFYSPKTPKKLTWLGKVLREFKEEDLVGFAGGVDKFLVDTDPTQVKKVWFGWMKKYWVNRLVGNPHPVGPEESERMFEWLPHLEGVVDEAVDYACKMKAQPLTQTDLYWNLQRKNTVSVHPQAVTRLLAHLLPAATPPFYHCNQVETIVGQLVNVGIPIQQLRTICEHLARLGSLRVSKLVEAN